MDKPFSLVYEDFKRKLADTINNSGMPPFMVETILQNYLFEIGNMARKQYQTDKEQYESSLKEESFKDCD